VKRAVLVLALTLATALAARAEDVVTLKNGDRLTGTVVDLAGGKLKFKTAWGGEILVAWAEIASLQTESSIRIRLETDEIIEGTVTTREDGKLVIASAGAGSSLEVEFAKVRRINQPPDTWHGELGLGYFHSGGNTRKTSGIASVNLFRETERDRFQIKADFRYGRDRGVTTERKAYGLIKYDYKFTERFYGYISEELAHDRFKDTRIRTVTSAGVGLVVVNAEHTDLRAEAGLAYVTNDFYVEKDEGHLGGRLFVHFRQDLPLGLVFVNDLTAYPNFERSTDWQLRDEASISAGLGAGWNARVGVIWEYDHEVPKDRWRHDVLYFATLGYKF